MPINILAESALTFIQNDMVVGLGSGRASLAFVDALGQRVQQGLRIRGIPTSLATAERATSSGIHLTTLDEVESIDVAVDGADEVDPQLRMIKGLGGALLREKIIAAAAKQFIILVGREKLVNKLGDHGVLPVEVIPFAVGFCRREIAGLGYESKIRQVNNSNYVTDNGNVILDCQISALPDPLALDFAIRAIPGVVETGLFLGMADTVFIGDGTQVETRTRATA